MNTLLIATITAALAASSLAGLQQNPSEPQELSLQSLARYEAMWRANRPARYSFTIERTCFCLPRALDASFQVTGGVSKMQRSSDERARSFFQPYVSVDKLFGAMRRTLEADGRVAVVWGANKITPVQITLDPKVQIADDELYLTVSKFSR